MRRNKYKRDDMRITEEWVSSFCIPKLCEKDKHILKYIYINRLVTSRQVASLFWPMQKYSVDLCNRHLRKLFELHCIDRFFPPKEKGSSLQHVSLGPAGARVLGLEGYQRRLSLPVSYRHFILVSEIRLRLHKVIGWGEVEKKILDSLVTDIYYPQGIAIEADVGTENYQTLEEKAKRYRMSKLEWVCFVTTGPQKRCEKFYGLLNSNHRACIRLEDIDKLAGRLKSC